MTKKIFSILMVCAVAVSATAVPARRDGVVRTLEDGTEVTVYQNGDENFHYLTNDNEEWLDETTLKPITIEEQASRTQAGERRRQIRRAQQETGSDRLLAPRGAIILVSYTDKAFSSSNADMTKWAMGETYTYNGATGSVRQYFYDQSWGQYQMEIDVYGPVTVSQNMKYYGENDSQGSDKRPEELIKEACILAHDSCGADFSKYDSNNDGYVDWVVILYAGKGEADGGTSTTIWPHQYDLHYTGKTFKLDGKTVDHYCCLNEIDGWTNKRAGIGTFCHEFSHVMGLPDLYTTNYATHKTMGEWDIMDYGPYNNGGNTPAAYSAYERWFMGWMEPTLLTGAAAITLEELCESQKALYMTEDGSSVSNILNPRPYTFYMLENRQQVGWDKYLPGHGLLITKVMWNASKWSGNTVNNNSKSMGVDLLEADGQAPSGSTGKAGDAYPAGADSFTKVADFQITDIAENSSIITFDLNGGGRLFPKDGKQVKFLQDGLFYFFRNGRIYDFNGRLVKESVQ